ncbi:hypothetical protein GCM10009559_28570 [Pseudonocardia zijingensis]|uniref:IclR-ED domain-containing protein n=1 Tax=Pseudonocardia zijingensis TaxID=153376 RepID=A0ABN1Q2G7_9PSEU
MPLLDSAIGCAIVAFGPDPIAEAAAVLSIDTDGVGTWAAEIDLLATQFRGYAVRDDPHDPALRGVAAPVFGARGHVRMGVEVQGPVVRLPESAFDELGATVRAAADARPDVLAGERREQARVRSERRQRWGRPRAAA